MTNSERGERPSLWLIIAAFAAIYVLWGSTYLAIKYAIETLPPLLMAGVRFIVAGAVLYVWARTIGGAQRPLKAHWRTAFVVGALLLLCGNGGVVWAESRIASGLAALLVAIEPLFIVLLTWSLPGGKRPGWRVVAGLLTGFAGVWLLIGYGFEPAAADGESVDLLGAAAVIGAALAWAIGSLYSLRAPTPQSPFLASGMQMLAGGALVFAVGLLAGEWRGFDVNAISLRSLGALAYLCVFGSIIAFTAYSWLLRVTSPTRVATYAYVNPVVAVLLGWWLAGEALTSRTMLAAAVIIGSVMLITSYGKHAALPANDEREAGA